LPPVPAPATAPAVLQTALNPAWFQEDNAVSLHSMDNEPDDDGSTATDSIPDLVAREIDDDESTVASSIPDLLARHDSESDDESSCGEEHSATFSFANESDCDSLMHRGLIPSTGYLQLHGLEVSPSSVPSDGIYLVSGSGSFVSRFLSSDLIRAWSIVHVEMCFRDHPGHSKGKFA
jgi:hypothetical protein